MKLKLLFIATITMFGLMNALAQTGTGAAVTKTSFRPSDLEFSAVEGWRLGEKTAIPMEESGIWVNYDSPERERVTVYVYARGQKGFSNDLSGVIKDEFEGAKDALKTVADAGVYKNLKIGKSETVTVASAGSVKALKAVLTFEAGGNKLSSEIFVFPYKGHVVKLRASRLATLTSDEGYRRLLASLDALFSK